MAVFPIKAKPCPFCGEISDPIEAMCYDAHEGTKWGSFCCGACGAIGPGVRTGYVEWNTPREGLDGKMETWGNRAIREWNQRKPAEERQGRSFWHRL